MNDSPLVEILAEVKSNSKKLDAHDKHFSNVETTLKKHDKRLTRLERTTERIIVKLCEHDMRFERIEERLDQLPTRAEFFQYMDGYMQKTVHVWNEQTFLSGRVEIIEETLERNSIV